MSKHSVISWIGSWSRKRTLVEEIVNPSKGCNLVNIAVPVLVS